MVVVAVVVVLAEVVVEEAAREVSGGEQSWWAATPHTRAHIHTQSHSNVNGASQSGSLFCFFTILWQGAEQLCNPLLCEEMYP